jgi:ferrous iron transport protein A
LSVAELKLGQSGIIKSVQGSGLARIRLLELGLTSGSKITLFKRAPTGDPLDLIVRGLFHLTLRSKEASLIHLI